MSTMSTTSSTANPDPADDGATPIDGPAPGIGTNVGYLDLHVVAAEMQVSAEAEYRAAEARARHLDRLSLRSETNSVSSTAPS